MLSMQAWSQENPRVKINWEVAFEKFSESKMCGNIKGKREICLSQRWKKILAWKYFDQFWYFGHIFLLRYLINLLLAAIEIELKDLKLCSLPKFQNLLYERPKLTWNLTHGWKRGMTFYIFLFGKYVF